MVTARVIDAAGATATTTFLWTVNWVNDFPVLTANQTLVAVNEGQTASNSGTVSDLDGDPVMLSASIGTVANNGDGSWSWSFITSDGPTQSQTVIITADDGFGGITQTPFNLVVSNVPPTASFANLSGILIEGETAVLNFSDPLDPSPDDPWQVLCIRTTALLMASSNSVMSHRLLTSVSILSAEFTPRWVGLPIKMGVLWIIQ